MAVLVAYDGSEPAHAAVEHAVETHPEDQLILLRVVELADGVTSAGINLLREQFDPDDAAPEVTAALVDLLEDEEIDFEVETTVGEPARAIVDFADDHDVHHIIVGSHGRKGVSRVLLGSVAEKVVRRAPVPVTVVR